MRTSGEISSPPSAGPVEASLQLYEAAEVYESMDYWLGLRRLVTTKSGSGQKLAIKKDSPYPRIR
jgi:hypothetical protein